MRIIVVTESLNIGGIYSIYENEKCKHNFSLETCKDGTNKETRAEMRDCCVFVYKLILEKLWFVKWIQRNQGRANGGP